MDGAELLRGPKLGAAGAVPPGQNALQWPSLPHLKQRSSVLNFFLYGDVVGRLLLKPCEGAMYREGPCGAAS